MSAKRDFYADFEVKFGKTVVSVEMPASASVYDLKQKLEEQTHVRAEKQRLLLNPPVTKEKHRDPPFDTTLRQLFPAALVERCEQHEGPIAAHLKVSAMLLGSAEVAPAVNVAATAEVSRLVATSVEHNGKLLRCSYAKGYLLQTAYVCRTCVDDGRADPQHALCLACAAFCHGNHQVEDWGERPYMRCDCCTEKCWRTPAATTPAESEAVTGEVHTGHSPDAEQRAVRKRSRSCSSPVTPDTANTTPEKAENAMPGRRDSGSTADTASDDPPPPPQSRCAFVVDSKTRRPPVESVLPANKHNRYPRDPLNWCYCKTRPPSDDPECYGVTCLLCLTLFWSTHITRLFTEQYRRVPCYGEVPVGDTVAFHCDTCNTDICAPCRYRCHKDHDVAPGCFVVSAEEGADNGTTAETHFSCGCRDLCKIAETVPEELIDDASTYAIISDADAAEMIKNDVLAGFLCAYCMQEHPWIATEDPLKCYDGTLPPTVQTKKPVIACGTKAAAPSSPTPRTGGNGDTFPYHGMLLPADSFTPNMTCSCAPCCAAYEKFAPRSLDGEPDMIMELHDLCSNCGKSMKVQQAYICRTCELNKVGTFFICQDCNALRQVLAAVRGHVPSSRSGAEASSSGHNGSGGAGGAVGDDDHHAAEITSSADATSTAASAEEAEHVPYNAADHHAGGFSGYSHDLSHEFVEDSLENLSALWGKQMTQNIDPEMLEHATFNGGPERNQAEVDNTLSLSLGQIPLQFSDEELRDVVNLNQRRKQLQNGSNNNK